MTNTVDRINGRLDRAEGQICVLEDIAIEAVQVEAQSPSIHKKYDTP